MFHALEVCILWAAFDADVVSRHILAMQFSVIWRLQNLLWKYRSLRQILIVPFQANALTGALRSRLS
jgi:hypothetical protein